MSMMSEEIKIWPRLDCGHSETCSGYASNLVLLAVELPNGDFDRRELLMCFRHALAAERDSGACIQPIQVASA